VIWLGLDEIRVDPGRFQRRAGAFASETVEAILAEGYRPEKFDPIPVVRDGSSWIVGGDGHSRFEALRQLRAAGRPVPDQIPCRRVEPREAEALADTANISRTPFSALEEAEIFRRRMDAGEDLQDIARDSHRSAFYVQTRAQMADLCEGIKRQIGTGLSVEQAVALARACAQHHLDHAAQSRLWHDVLSKGDYTVAGVGMAVRIFAAKLRQAQNQGGLFELPVNLRCEVEEMERRQRRILKVRSALATLKQHADLLSGPVSGIILQAADPECRRLVNEYNEAAAALGMKQQMWHYGAA
jgi:ParB-like chromosome segregation protein Spo0J